MADRQLVRRPRSRWRLVIGAALLWQTGVAAADRDPLETASELLGLGSPREAEEVLRPYLQAQPDDPDAHRLLGVALAMIPRRSAAIEALDRAVELKSDDPANHLVRGQVLAQFGEHGEARRAFRTALSLEPKLGPAHEGLALSLALSGELAKAVHHLTAAIVSAPDDATKARLHYLRGKAYVQLEQTGPACAEFDAATRLNPSLGLAFLEWGRILTEGDDAAKASIVLSRAAEELPDNFDAQYVYGSQLLRDGEGMLAVDVLTRAVQLDPEDRPAAYALGRALRQAGQPYEARKILSEIARAGSARAVSDADINEAGRLNNLGLEMEARGEYAAALGKYQAAASIAPRHIDFQRNAGLALCRLERWEEAKPWLRGVLQIAPGDIDATKALQIALEHAPDSE